MAEIFDVTQAMAEIIISANVSHPRPNWLKWYSTRLSWPSLGSNGRLQQPIIFVLAPLFIIHMCKVVIPGGRDGATVYAGGRKCGWWMNEGVTDGRTEGRKDGTYSAGLKDSASAYVLCPRLTEQCIRKITLCPGQLWVALRSFRGIRLGLKIW